MRAHFIGIVMALAGLPGIALAHPPAQLGSQADEGVIEEIHAFRKALAEAVRNKDAATLRGMYAEKFTHTHTSAKIDGRDARIVALLAGEPVIETAPVDNLSVAIHAGGWAAVAAGISPIKAMTDGKIYAVHWTATYVRTERSWQLAASHATRGKEIAP